MVSPKAATSVPSAVGPADPTFRRHTAKQSASYVAGRSSYPEAPIQTILTHHTATGGGCSMSAVAQATPHAHSRRTSTWAFGVEYCLSLGAFLSYSRWIRLALP